MIRRVLLLLLLLAPALCAAQTACNFVSTPAMAFGIYDDSAPAPTDSATTITVRCFRNGGPSSASVTLQAGPSGNSGLTGTRQLRSGASLMNYNLYRDAGRSQVLGQTSGADTATITINGIPNNGGRDGTFTIFGRIPAQQNVGAGAYGDSVTITLTP